MQRKFLRNLALLLVLNLLIKPFWIFGIDRTVQNTVGAEEYGFYFAIFNFSFLFYILLDFGITTFNNKNIAQNSHLLNKHFSNILGLKLILFTIYLIFTFIGAFLINYSREQMYLLAFLGLNQFLVSFILYLRSNLGGLLLFRTDSFISVLDRSFMILICSILLWGNIVDEFKIAHFVYAQSVSLAVTALISLVIVINKTHNRFLRLNWNLPFFLLMLKQSFPFAILVLLMTFYNRIDSVMLERLLPDGAKYSGIYASAYRLLDAGNMLPFLFAVLLLPIYARMLKNNQCIEDLVKLSYILIIVPAIIIAVTSVFYAEEFMRLLYPMHPAETLADFEYRIARSSVVFTLLMVSFCAISTMYIFSTLLTANGSLKYLNIAAFSGVIINVGLNLLLIPAYDAVGSAVATLVTQLLISIVQVWIVVRLFGFRFNYPLLIRLFVFLPAVVLIAFAFRQFSFRWELSFIITIACAMLLAIFTKLWNLQQIFDIIKYDERE